jgi:6-pyruvoyltetrahydropterin/6-carboxytetrahydropterin synthase
MLHTLSKTFIFEAAHTLQRKLDAEGSRRIHGHSYCATIAMKGHPNKASGMLLDLGEVDIALEQVRGQLDHRFLDEVTGLGPATLENLCSFIWKELSPTLPYLSMVSVSRPLTGDMCSISVDAHND